MNHHRYTYVPYLLNLSPTSHPSKLSQSTKLELTASYSKSHPLLHPLCPRLFSMSASLFSSVSHSVMSDSLQPHGLQHTRLPCPSPTPRAYSNSCPSELVMPSNHLILCCPILLPSIFPSIRVFSNESVLHIQWPFHWSFIFNISPSNEHPGLISFRMDCLDLLAVQGTLKSLLQHHSSKASIFCSSAFFIVHLSYPYKTTGETIALTRQTFVGKVMSLLFNMLSWS